MRNVRTIFIFSILGVLFAGYLTFTKLLLGVCPLNEPCPNFLGYPSCLTGLVLYLMIFFASLMLLLYETKKNACVDQTLRKTILWTSLIGIMFAIYSTYQELFVMTCLGGCTYTLLLPTCVYGLVMYVVIFLLSIKLAFKKK